MAESLRTRVLMVYLGTVVVLVAGLLLYVLHEGSVAGRLRVAAENRRIQEEAETGSRAMRDTLGPGLDPLLRRVESSIEQLLANPAQAYATDGISLRRALHDLPIWREPEFLRSVAQVAIVARSGAGIPGEVFNAHHSLAFAPETFGREPFRLVEASLERDDIVVRGDRVAGPLRMLEADWGGYFLRLRRRHFFADDRLETPATRSLTLIMLLALPGLALLLGASWSLLSRRVIKPVEEMGRVARGVVTGDYSRRLAVTKGRRDEVARVMVAFNRMLALAEEYRDEMEDRVRRATDEIARKNRELMLAQRLAATGTLAAGIAHEINNPLGGMLNVVRKLDQDVLTPEARRRYLDVLEDCIDRIGTIVRKVLEVSPRKTTPTAVNLVDAAQRSMDLVAHRAEKAGVVMSLASSGPAPVILGEANEIGQVCLNLLINAVDACVGGGRIDIRLASDERWATVQIEDNGEGMPPEVAERAFDLFFTTKDSGKGTGLGLAMVHHMVQAHGGNMSLESRPGVGTVVTVRFPRGEDSSPHA